MYVEEGNVPPSLCVYLLWLKLSEMGDWTLRVSGKAWRGNDSQPTGALALGYLGRLGRTKARLTRVFHTSRDLSHMQ
jgi:hypothetical protein